MHRKSLSTTHLNISTRSSWETGGGGGGTLHDTSENFPCSRETDGEWDRRRPRRCHLASGTRQHRRGVWPSQHRPMPRTCLSAGHTLCAPPSLAPRGRSTPPKPNATVTSSVPQGVRRLCQHHRGPARGLAHWIQGTEGRGAGSPWAPGIQRGRRELLAAQPRGDTSPPAPRRGAPHTPSPCVAGTASFC